jgi:hypothetical protein
MDRTVRQSETGRYPPPQPLPRCSSVLESEETMSERKCRFCLYWYSRLPGRIQPKDETLGECRFGPPVVPASTEHNRPAERRGAWPETYGRDWCGQFSLSRWPQPGGYFKTPPTN